MKSRMFNKRDKERKKGREGGTWKDQINVPHQCFWTEA